MNEQILVSACLLGIHTRYDGGGQPAPHLVQWAAQGQVVPVCPEVAGGLATPRTPAEIVGGDGADVLAGRARVLTRSGQDVTGAFIHGAEIVLRSAQRLGIRSAILMPRSPSCGLGHIYDGTFSGILRAGDGVCAALLRDQGIAVYVVSDLNHLLEKLG